MKDAVCRVLRLLIVLSGGCDHNWHADHFNVPWAHAGTGILMGSDIPVGFRRCGRCGREEPL